MKIIVYQTGQSGGIPVVNWLAGNIIGKENAITISPHDGFLEIPGFGFYKNRSEFGTDREKSIFYQNDRLVDTNWCDGDLNNDDYQVVILRDPMNLKYQGSFDENVWLNHATFAEKSMLASSENEGRPKKFFILFNKWLVDRDYRNFLCSFLGIENKIDSVDTIPEEIKTQFLTGYLSNISSSWMSPEMKHYCKSIFPDIQINDEAKKEEPKKEEPKKEEPKKEEPKKKEEVKKKVKFADSVTKTSVKGVSIVNEKRSDGFKVSKVVVDSGVNKVGRVLRNGEKTLGISGIVLNESAIILDCLRSISDYLDYWVINDTGSTDGTQQIILDFFVNRRIPGELHMVPWKNFSYNRNVALSVAKSKTDFCILMDADFIAHIKDTEFKHMLKTPGYLIRYEGGLDYRQILLINCKFDWTYYGVTHEYIDVKPNQVPVEITEVFTFEHTGKGSNREDKFQRDVNLLLEGIKEEPENARYYFYLAQSYKDWSHFDEAIKYYEKRISFGKWDEEVFYSHYQIGLCKKRRGDPFWNYVGDFLNAFMGRRHRIEPVYQILEDCAYDQDKAEFGLKIGLMAENMGYPSYDLLFIEKPLYLWMFHDMLATCAYTAKRYDVAYRVTRKILESGQCQSQPVLQRFRKNLDQLKLMLDQSGTDMVEFQPFQFQRFNVNEKKNRIAVILVNYNLTERANSLVRHLKRLDFGMNLDIIVVDNGSDMVKPSMYTTVRLEKNIEEGLGIAHGLKFAESLALVEEFEYAGYLFLSTSGEILPSQNRESGGIDGSRIVEGKAYIGEMMKFLETNLEYAAVGPSLTIDSVTHWAQLINLGLNGGIGGIEGYQMISSVGKNTNLLDLSCSLYRGSWFRSYALKSILETPLISGYGLDLELSYLTRQSGQEMAVLQHLNFRKISEVGYRIGRIKIEKNKEEKNGEGENGDVRKRILQETMKMTQILDTKYSSFGNGGATGSCIDGPKGSETNGDDLGALGLMDININTEESAGFHVRFQKNMKPEKVRTDYYENNVDSLIDTILNFEKSEGAHKLLMESVYFRFLTYQSVSSPVMIEIGGTNNVSYVHHDSTKKLCQLAQVYGYHFVSVDLDPNVVIMNQNRLDHNDQFKNGHNGFEYNLVQSDGKIFLERMNDLVPSLSGKSLYFVYLDLGNEESEISKLNELCQLVTPLISVGGMLCLSVGEEDRKLVLEKGDQWSGIWTMIGQSPMGVIFQKMPNEWGSNVKGGTGSQVGYENDRGGFQGGELITKKEFNLK